MPARAIAAHETEGKEGEVLQRGRVVTVASAHTVHDTYQGFVAPLQIIHGVG